MSDSTAAVVSHPDRPTLWSEAVGVLTRAIRLIRKRGDGTEEPDDFADFLATALTAAAANVGSVDRVTEGRPGSWEASHIHELLRGMVGYEDEARVLIGYRTDPVRVPLNVAQLVEDSGCLPTFDEAMRAIGWPGHGDGTFGPEHRVVTCLPGGELHGDQGAHLIAECVDLGRQAASGASDGVIGGLIGRKRVVRVSPLCGPRVVRRQRAGGRAHWSSRPRAGRGGRGPGRRGRHARQRTGGCRSGPWTSEGAAQRPTARARTAREGHARASQCGTAR